MNVVLIVLGILGVGAIVIAAYVFTVAARTYVSAEELARREESNGTPARPLVERSPLDRRSGKPVTFPLTVNGVVIPQDRRQRPDRRKAA
jgi:hypothetical protein